MFLHDVRTVSVAIILAALVGGVTPMAALSQTSGQPSLLNPKQLKPSERARSGADKESKTHSVYRAHPVDRPLSGIQVNRLGAVNADAVGILSDSQGGFGMDLWKGSRLVFIKRLFDEHPERVRSRVMRGLLRRVLLSAATPPKGSKGTAFTAIRLNTLMAMGEFEASLELLKIIPKKNREAAFRKLEVELHLVTGKAVQACATVAREITRRKEAFWQKALIYCQILAGDTSKAEFGLALLQETETVNPMFLALAEGMINGEPKLPKVIKDISILHVAMLQMAKLVLPLPTARRYPAALISMAKDPAAMDRLDALEIAAEDGFMTDEILREQYMAALPTARSENVSDTEDEVLGSLRRARLFEEALRVKIPVAKAEALSRAEKSARKAERLGGVARLFGPLTNTLTPESDLLWVAPAAFRMQILDGQQERAAAWFALAQRNAASSSDASAIYKDLSPLGTIMELSYQATRKALPLDDLSEDQKILYLSLFHQLGGDVPPKLLETLIYRIERPTPLPDPVLWQLMTRLNDQKLSSQTHAESKVPSLHRAAAIETDESSARESGAPTVMAQTLRPSSGVEPSDQLPRIGERILMMLVVMGDRPLSDLNPIIISEIIHGLQQAGLSLEARNLAMEVAVNAGL